MKNFKRTKLACYMAYFTMSSIFSLPPLLFVTFRETYGISYTLLGTLVLINFCTQLSVDLIFTVFSERFNHKLVVRIMPLITSVGLATYALIPTFLPDMAYVGLVIGTVIFSVAAGLSEVMLSPVIAAIPSDTPQKDMSMLHSLYAFGVFTVVVVSTLFLRFFGEENWMYLTLFFALWPILSSVLFMTSPMPDMSPDKTNGVSISGTKKRAIGLALCAACIFFGSCAENAMGNWISGYMEKALRIDKALGDILGMAMFAVLLGLARILYARFGKNISRTLLVGMVGAVVCYLVAGLSDSIVLAFLACIVTGFCTSMLWPGTLIMMEEKIPHAGVAAYALMAAGGDMGAAIAPQLMGFVADSVAAGPIASELSIVTGLSAEQIGMKAGMLVSAIFPLIGVAVLAITVIFFKRNFKTGN